MKIEELFIVFIVIVVSRFFMESLVAPSGCVSCSFRKNESKPFEGIGIIEIPQLHSLYLIHISHK